MQKKAHNRVAFLMTLKNQILSGYNGIHSLLGRDHGHGPKISAFWQLSPNLAEVVLLFVSDASHFPRVDTKYRDADILHRDICHRT